MGKHDEGVVGFPRILWYVSDTYIIVHPFCNYHCSLDITKCTHMYPSPATCFLCYGSNYRAAGSIPTYRRSRTVPDELQSGDSASVAVIGFSFDRVWNASSSDISPTRIPPRSSTSPNAPLYRTVDRLDRCFVVACVGMGPSA
jgi:hypothetical protein